MQASRFEMEAERPAGQPQEQRTDPEARASLRAPGDGDDESRRDETIEEPGYGHGV
jgi:hypothetical protein